MINELENFHKQKSKIHELIILANHFYDELWHQFDLLGLRVEDYFDDNLQCFNFEDFRIRFGLKKEKDGFLSIGSKYTECDHSVYFSHNGKDVIEIKSHFMSKLVHLVLVEMGLLKGEKK